jgi:hypothetical protein
VFYQLVSIYFMPYKSLIRLQYRNPQDGYEFLPFTHVNLFVDEQVMIPETGSCQGTGDGTPH